MAAQMRARNVRNLFLFALVCCASFAAWNLNHVLVRLGHHNAAVLAAHGRDGMFHGSLVQPIRRSEIVTSAVDAFSGAGDGATGVASAATDPVIDSEVGTGAADVVDAASAAVADVADATSAATADVANAEAATTESADTAAAATDESIAATEQAAAAAAESSTENPAATEASEEQPAAAAAEEANEKPGEAGEQASETVAEGNAADAAEERPAEAGTEAEAVTAEAAAAAQELQEAAQEPQEAAEQIPVEPEQEDLSRKYHVLLTASGGVYQEWQSLVCYFHYRKVKAANPESPMGGFTRLLHSGKPDDLMDQMPTVVVDPLPPGQDRGFMPLNRPYAIQQWVEKYPPKEAYVFMTEPDHVLLRPPPIPDNPRRSTAYPFWYIEPTTEKNKPIVERYDAKGVGAAKMAPIGNSPVVMHQDVLRELTPLWNDVSLKLKGDAEADAAFGWILEMYGFSIAASQLNDGPHEFELRYAFMVQPPYDQVVETCDNWPRRPMCKAEQRVPATLIHFTYGQDFDMQGKFTRGVKGPWHWDKRDFTITYPPVPANPQPPAGVPETVHILIAAVEEAGKSYGHVWDRKVAGTRHKHMRGAEIGVR